MKYFTRLLLICTLIPFFISCATLVNKKTIGVSIYSDIDSALVCFKDNDECYITPVTVDLPRSKSDVELIVKKDSVKKEVVLKSKLSGQFWLGNLFNGTGVVGYAVDLSSPKRFTYPKYNFISLADSTTNVEPENMHKWIPSVKNQVNIKISVPEGNHFYINKQSCYGSSFGFLGFSSGIEYYYSDRNSINIDFGVMTDFIIPVPAPVDYEGCYNRSFAKYLDIQIGRDINSFQFDFGIQGNRTKYQERETVEVYPDYIDTLKYSAEQFNAGIAFSGYYKITNGFCLGMNYYPSFFAWNKGDFDLHYSHLFTFELIFKINAYRPVKKKAGYRMEYKH